MVRIVVIIVLAITSVVTTFVYHITQRADIEYYQARRYFEKGEYSEAILLYEKSLSVNPSHTRALKDIGYSFQWTGRYDEAIAVFRKLLSIKPGDDKIKMALADTLAWQKKYPEAAAIFKGIMDKTCDPQAVLGLAEIYQWDGEFEKSKELLKMLPQSMVNDPRARLLYARALLYTGDPGAATQIIEALRLENTVKADRKMYAETEKLLAEALMMGKDYAQAIERYKKRVEQDPKDLKARMVLADMFSWVKRYDEAIAGYAELLRLEPGNAEARVKLARVYSWVKEYNRAEELLRQALASDKSDISSRILLADILSWQKRYDEAIAEYEKATSDKAADPETMKKLADVASWAKDYDKAARVYGMLLVKDPGNNQVRAALAEILSWQKKYDGSISEYKIILGKEPENAAVMKALARVYSWNKEYPEAERLYRMVMTKDPADKEARLALGELLLWQRKHREAVGYFRSMMAGGDDTNVRMMYGEALLYSSEYRDSREIFNGILSKEPDNAQAKTLLADSYAYDKEFKRAIELYEEALKTSPDRRTRRKLADVLSWDKKYDRAIKIYDELTAEEEDYRIWLQKARVLGWARRYPEALMEYKLIADSTADPIVRLEMEAKRAYWDDRVESAIAFYRRLITEDPENVEAMFDLSQICSYQAMWKDAMDEYHRILEIAPGHFRAREGLEKAELMARRIPWESGYEFYEADSLSRDMDIRRHTIFNKFTVPVNHNTVIDGTYKFTARSFSDFPDVVENEGRFKLAYIFNPKLWLDGFYDLLAYNRDISALHTFGASSHLRIADSSVVNFWYERQRLENNSTVIRGRYYSDDFKERIDASVDKRLKLGADYLYSRLSDGNQRWEPGFDVLYYFSLDPLRLTLKYRYFYRQFEDKVPQYFSPRGFTTNTVSLNWRHFLNKEEIFFGADDIYYDLGYNFSVDSTSIVGHQYTGLLHWDINKRLALDVQGTFSLSSNDVYRESGVKGSFKYYF